MITKTRGGLPLSTLTVRPNARAQSQGRRDALKANDTDAQAHYLAAGRSKHRWYHPFSTPEQQLPNTWIHMSRVRSKSVQSHRSVRKYPPPIQAIYTLDHCKQSGKVLVKNLTPTMIGRSTTGGMPHGETTHVSRPLIPCCNAGVPGGGIADVLATGQEVAMNASIFGPGCIAPPTRARATKQRWHEKDAEMRQSTGGANIREK